MIARIFFWIFIVLTVLNTYLFFAFRSFENDNISPTCYFFALVYDVILFLLGEKINPMLTSYIIAISGILIHIWIYQIIEDPFCSNLAWQELKKDFAPLYDALFFWDGFLLVLEIKMPTYLYAVLLFIPAIDSLKAAKYFQKESKIFKTEIQCARCYAFFAIYQLVLIFLFLVL